MVFNSIDNAECEVVITKGYVAKTTNKDDFRAWDTRQFQIFAQSEAIFAVGQTFIADFILRVRLLEFLQLSLGSCVWKDIEESRLGNKLRYHKLLWGLAISF